MVYLLTKHYSIKKKKSIKLQKPFLMNLIIYSTFYIKYRLFLCLSCIIIFIESIKKYDKNIVYFLAHFNTRINKQIYANFDHFLKLQSSSMKLVKKNNSGAIKKKKKKKKKEFCSYLIKYIAFLFCLTNRNSYFSRHGQWKMLLVVKYSNILFCDSWIFYSNILICGIQIFYSIF